MGSAISIQQNTLNLSKISKSQNNIPERDTPSDTPSENIFFFINNQFDIGESLFYNFNRNFTLPVQS